MSTSATAIRGPLIKTITFASVTMLVLAFVAIQLGQFKFKAMNSYSARFTTASELFPGDPVLLSGVEVGKVSDVSVTDEHDAMVVFDVDRTVKLSTETAAAVRYRNLTGDRYLDLVPGADTAAAMQSGDEIPLARTKPAVDLDVLLGGLKPLFRGLDPDEINQFSREIVTVLQGQGGDIEDTLSHVASFSRTLAERDEVIGSTINNLNSVLGNLDEHSVDLSSTIDELQQVTTALATDRRRIGGSLDSVDRLTTSMAGLLADLRGPLDGTVEQLGRAASQADQGLGTINDVLRMLPGAYLRLGRLASRGAGYSIYVCGLRAMIDGPNGQPVYLPWIGPDARVPRCQFGTAPLEMPEDRTAATVSEGGQR